MVPSLLSLAVIGEKLRHSYPVLDDIFAQRREVGHFFIDSGDMIVEDFDQFRGNLVKIFGINIENL